MTAFGVSLGLTAPCACSRSNWGSVRPPRPRPPILRKSRRETRSQSLCDCLPQTVNMGQLSYSVRNWREQHQDHNSMITSRSSSKYIGRLPILWTMSETLTQQLRDDLAITNPRRTTD